MELNIDLPMRKKSTEFWNIFMFGKGIINTIALIDTLNWARQCVTAVYSVNGALSLIVRKVKNEDFYRKAIAYKL
jgi:hypothetical protein